MIYLSILWIFKYRKGGHSCYSPMSIPARQHLFGQFQPVFAARVTLLAKKILFLEHSGMAHAISVKRNEGRFQKQNCLFYPRFSCTFAEIEKKRN